MVLFNVGSAGSLVVGVAIGLFLGEFYDFSAGSILPKSSSSVNKPLDRTAIVTTGRSVDAKYTTSSPTQRYNNATTSPPPLSLIDEYIPVSLRHKYEPHNLQFNVTRSMLLKSRPVIGNNERLHAFLRKLHAKQCTTVLFLGGSVTAGHNAKGREKSAYPTLFMEFLDELYPCVEDNQGNNNGGTAADDAVTADSSVGRHRLKKTHAQNSQTHMTSWSMVDGIESFDLVLLEFNINDHFVSDLSHALEDKGPIGETEEYISLWYYEVILRRLLRMRTPDPPAIITFNADYVGRSWAKPPNNNDEKSRKTLFRYNQEPLKNWISSMYEIPVFSAVQWLLPLAGKFGTGAQFPEHREDYAYSTSAWHADRCCHPRREGHRILNLVLAYNLIEEEKRMMTMMSQQRQNLIDAVVREEHDFTTDDDPIMRDAIYLSPEEEALYVENDLDNSGVDFTDPHGKELWEDAIVANDGWTWFADNKEKDKFGYIADDNSGGQHVGISLIGGKHGIIEVSFVVSYENFGIALAWLTNSNNNDKEDLCKEGVNNWKSKAGKINRLNAIWDEKASVPKVMLLDERLKEGESKILHICLTPPGEKHQGQKNKFKLLGVRVY